MGQIGCFGNLVFETSDRRILTMSNIKQEVSGQWTEHKIIGQKPRKEFGGPGVRLFKFTITLDISLGVSPSIQMELIEDMVENGYTDYLVIGNKTIGENRFVITSVSEAWDAVYAGGKIAKATLNITMEEYV